MKNIKLAKTLIILNLLFILIYNSYFGWNLFAESEAEKLCDRIANWFNIGAIFFYLLPLTDLYESTIKQQEQ